MDNPVVKEGKYTGIIVRARAGGTDGTADYIVRLDMVVTAGAESYKHFEKVLFFKADELSLAKSRFNRMGGELRGWDTLLEDAAGLIGNKLVVEVWHAEQETDYIRVNIHGYVGKDNPKKYSSG